MAQHRSFPQLRSISQLIAEGVEIRVNGYTLQRWSDGTYFIESPNGEGTEIKREALELALRRLFLEHF